MGRTLRAAAIATAVVAAAALLAAARPWTGSTHYAVTGTVVGTPEGRVVAVAHDAIPGYMPAMTMPFTAAEELAPLALREGDRVSFRLRIGSDSAVIDRIVVAGRAAPRAAAPGRPAVSRLKTGDAVPAFALVDQAGQPVTESDLAGHLTVVSFVYTRCPLPEFCPLIMRRYQELQREIQRDPTLAAARLLAITLDPGFDRPDVLQAYATARRADAAWWRFVTGDADQVARLSRAFAVYNERNGVTIDHTLATALIDDGGRVAALWRGNRWDSAEVLAALRSASRAGAAAAHSVSSPSASQGHTR